jgi:hypothetical protein
VRSGGIHTSMMAGSGDRAEAAAATSDGASPVGGLTG